MPLIVTADDLARRLGLEQPLGSDVRWLIEAAIGDAQTDVEAYLGRAVTPTQYVESGLLPAAWGWPLAYDPVIEITTVVAETDPVSGLPTGWYTVTYTAGLDASSSAATAPIRRYVMAAAVNSPGVTALWRTAVTGAGRVVRSLSAEGQSVSYDTVTAGGGPVPGPGVDAPGVLPSITSLDRWRVANRRIYQRPGTWV